MSILKFKELIKSSIRFIDLLDLVFIPTVHKTQLFIVCLNFNLGFKLKFILKFRLDSDSTGINYFKLFLQKLLALFDVSFFLNSIIRIRYHNIAAYL